MTTRKQSNSIEYPASTPDLFPRTGASPFLSATALLGVNALSAQMRVWRTWFDAAHNLMRMQQDAALEMARSQLSRGESKLPDNPSALTQAMESTSHAYESLGAAWLDAQRSAYEALTRSADTRH
jgi:hypothetical protein